MVSLLYGPVCELSMCCLMYIYNDLHESRMHTVFRPYVVTSLNVTHERFISGMGLWLTSIEVTRVFSVGVGFSFSIVH